jgi:hypothetical protein
MLRHLAALLLLTAACQVAAISDASEYTTIGEGKDIVEKKRRKFKTPKDFFIQERASKQLPGPGQHFSFGALKSWEDIHAFLDSSPSELILIIIILN